jgi:Rad3-related DNA helicase
MNIDLSNEIVIFDEAHNMEDASREAASFTVKQNEMQKAMQDCEKIKNIGGAEPHALGELVSENGNYEMYGVVG